MEERGRRRKAEGVRHKAQGLRTKRLSRKHEGTKARKKRYMLKKREVFCGDEICAGTYTFGFAESGSDLKTGDIHVGFWLDSAESEHEIWRVIN
jgi:hypothetical protein